VKSKSKRERKKEKKRKEKKKEEETRKERQNDGVSLFTAEVSMLQVGVCAHMRKLEFESYRTHPCSSVMVKSDKKLISSSSLPPSTLG